MKLIASGVTKSAAMTRSPSFSRSSSSTRITIRPAFSSAMISGVEASKNIARFGRDKVGGDSEVAFVVGVFLVDENHHRATLERGVVLGGGGESFCGGRRGEKGAFFPPPPMATRWFCRFCAGVSH